MKSTVAVVGSGVMGAGLATVAAVAGHTVIVCARSERSADRAAADVASALHARHSAARGPDPAEVLERISWTVGLSAAGRADVVLESVPERLELKREVFAELGVVSRADTLLATNTSGLPVSAIAGAVPNPERVLGAHFFAPVPAMPLCELIRAERTSDEALHRAQEFVTGLGKSSVVVDREVAGFVTTRLMAVLVLEAVRLVESGVASAADVDRACRLGFRHAMGPLETADLSGLDTLLDVADEIHSRDPAPAFAAPPMLREMVAAGRRGRKSGRGFHDYAKGAQP